MGTALLFGADPKKISRGPNVFVADGVWRVIALNLKDSILGLCDGLPTPIPLASAVVTGPTTIHVKVINPGTEQHISVFLERAA